MRRFVARLSGLVAFAGFAGLLGTDVLNGLQANHSETLISERGS